MQHWHIFYPITKFLINFREQLKIWNRWILFWNNITKVLHKHQFLETPVFEFLIFFWDFDSTFRENESDHREEPLQVTFSQF